MNYNKNIKRFKITFSFELINNVDQILYNTNILQKSFSKDVSYLLEINEENADKIIYYLLLTTSKQIKIEDISSSSYEEFQEVGTDKPIGSKDAIDEN